MKFIQEVKEKCKTCGKETKYMYRLNCGLYCKKHVESALLNEKVKMGLEQLKDRLQSFNRQWNPLKQITS